MRYNANVPASNRFFNFLRRPLKLSLFAAILSIFTLIAYHIPFFKFVVNNVEGGFNSFLIVTSLIILMLALNFFFYYLSIIHN